MREGQMGRMAPGALLMALLLVGASAWTANAAQQVTPSDEVRREVSEALTTIGQYGGEKRDEAVAVARKALHKTDATIDQVQERIDRDWDRMDASARKEARETLNALRRQRTDLAEWYGGLKHSSAQTWDELKKGFARSYSKLGKSLEKAVDKF